MIKLFGRINMSWKRVILFAIVSGVYTGIVAAISFLKNTSFQDISVYLEWWFIFAIIIVVNCNKWTEASLKVFVFFLISQPLVYLVQVPFSHLGWQIFMYYKYWFMITLLTLPGAAIAFLIKKGNCLSAFVLSVPGAYFAASTVSYAIRAINHFPYHLLSSISCLVFAIFTPYLVMGKKKELWITYIITAITFSVCAVLKISF